MKKRIVIEHENPDLQSRFKLECLKEGKSMTEKITRWIKSYLKTKQQEG